VSDEPIVPQDPFHPVGLGRHFQITPSGLAIAGEPSFETCSELWESLRTLERALPFAIGDAMLYFRMRFGHKADQIIDAAGISDRTASVYEWTAKNVPPERRRMEVLSYKQHQLVAALPRASQETWLQRAATGENDKRWSTGRLTAAIKTGVDAPPVGYYILVRTKGEQDRETLTTELESRGYVCTATEKRKETEAVR